MTEPGLGYVGRTFINFKDNSFRWIDLKEFHIPVGLSAEDALRQLLEHARYRDHYTSEDSHEHDSESLHGPYELRHIEADSFELVDEQQAIDLVRGFTRAYGDPGVEVLDEIDRVVYPVIRGSGVRYRLRDLGQEALHDFGWVLRDFTELVLIDPANNREVLLVAAID